jgi:hypothetical protein
MIKLIKNILINFIKIIFSLIVSLFILYMNFIIIINASGTKIFDWQIVLYVLFSIFVLLLIWILAFTKIGFSKKIMLILFFIIWLILPKILPNVMRQIDNDFCLDKGGCWDYIRNRCEMDNQGYCVKNSSDCEKNWQGSWNFKEKYCNIQKQ